MSNLYYPPLPRPRDDQQLAQAALRRIGDYDRSERAAGPVWRKDPQHVVVKRETHDYRPRSPSPLGRYLQPKAAQEYDRVLREPRDVDPQEKPLGVKRERVEDTFENNFPRIEGRERQAQRLTCC